ncbi:fungal-specific transcription factor domain-containing protein [Xylariaceae sp. FL0016]|nr:fungal-specific transcription factor domain-containing protein [Xylariaceae sp. FL0016]
METNTTSSGNPTQTQTKPLSCTQCRARKLKCSRVHPCQNCTRSGADCVYPARKRIQRPRKTKNTELLQRLNRLESIVGKVGLAKLEEQEINAGPDTPMIRPEPTSEGGRQAQSGVENQDAPLSGGLGRQTASQDSTTLRYMSGEFWSNLCNEVGGLKQALEQSTDSDEDEPHDETTPESMRSNSLSSTGVLLGSSPGARHDRVEHPAPEQIRYLTNVYFANVDMLMKILHQPSITAALHQFADSPTTELSPEREALFFAMFYASITSLSAPICLAGMAQPRSQLLHAYQTGLEQALARADYLNSSSLETLQALTLYACCLRSHNGSRSSWVLLSLPIRIAQAMNLHCDGPGTNFPPFEREQRRRLWWQLIVLDIRGAEDRGTPSLIGRGTYDTHLPHNVNDADFGPETTAPLVDRQGPTDMTFGLCTAQSSGIYLYFEHAQGAVAAGTPKQSEAEAFRHLQHLESQFVTRADPSHLGSYVTSVTVRLIILKFWLLLQYPLHNRGAKPSLPSAPPPTSASPPIAARPPTSTSTSSPFPNTLPRSANDGPVTRETTLHTAVSAMELSRFARSSSGPYGNAHNWWGDSYPQWHPLAVTLAELCVQTRGELVDRAWAVVDNVFPEWSEIIADTKRGSLWRPIRKLHKKAKAARQAALRADAIAPGAVWGAGYVQGDGPAMNKPAERIKEETSQVRQRPHPGADTTAVTENSMNKGAGEMMIESSLALDDSSAFGGSFNGRPPDLTNMSLTAPEASSLSQTWLAWPDLSFDQTNFSLPSSELAGENTIDWTTWDEFVFDTYAGTQSKSESSESI